MADATRLVDCRAELPLLLQRPLRGARGEAILVMLTPAAALFGGDKIDLHVSCAPETDVTLVTVGATRVNRGRVCVELAATVGAGARFRYLPHELIAFRDAEYHQRIRVDLEPGAEAVLLDVIAPGRGDEPFSYTQLDFDTLVSLSGTPVVRERFKIVPESRSALGRYTHYGSLLACGQRFDARHVHDRLADARIEASASSLPDYGIAARALGSAALPLREALLCAVGLGDLRRWFEP